MPDSGEYSASVMKESLHKLKEKAILSFNKVSTKEELLKTKASYLGKKGELKKILSALAKLSAEDKVDIGKVANEVKRELEEKVLNIESIISNAAQSDKLKKSIDITVPGRVYHRGGVHPLSSTMDAIIDVLEKLGFIKASGPEIEHDFYNFEALNIPKSHPARDMQDTFYIDKDVMLRTHTSPVQIRAMLAKKTPPLRVISAGRVYRRDEDITHSPMFTQVEGLYVDQDVSLADLKSTLQSFVSSVFSFDAKIRMRPSYFPFTEPSLEVDVSCFLAGSHDDCRLCKGTGWIEVLGAGMVDPAVLDACNIDSEKYRGFAFGVGVERIAMLRHGVTDIRLFFENDLRFLQQF